MSDERTWREVRDGLMVSSDGVLLWRLDAGCFLQPRPHPQRGDWYAECGGFQAGTRPTLDAAKRTAGEVYRVALKYYDPAEILAEALDDVAAP